ncbi:RsiV family protein [Bizionia arctica]|uniref:DUF3298 domain-containing protein n=1 Tax=Bizionia arctica TaxID=1495645 RepID=A0A917GC79_9FLAO|nr:RsiV family protein [Bizionia arctica]GGG37117.1 hypothetical protein GCM10010976_05990 [Bizionia arctica]
MKYLYVFLLLSLFSCKNDTKLEPPIVIDEVVPTDLKILSDSTMVLDKDIEISKVLSIKLKQKSLIEIADERNELKELIIEKKYFKEEDEYTLDFTYPLLNENLKPTNVNFNEYINDYYVDIIGTEAGILEDKALICDSIKIDQFREKRYIDYKIFNVNDQLVSVLFYKENFYSGTLHPTYSFDCMNFDLNRGVFMNYEDFFNVGSEVEFTDILNKEISKQESKGDKYYDCWKLSNDDFFENKNNFVVNETYVEYYFDDCVMCPSYAGSYSIKIPLVQLLSVLRKYDLNPLVL